MFTGIVEELGEVTAVEDLGDSSRFRLRGPVVTQGAKHGDSIAVNGVCLTVVDHEGDEFTADVMAETLKRSGLGALAVGSRVNLERPAWSPTAASAGTSSRATSTAPAPSSPAPLRELGDRQDLPPGGTLPLRRREGSITVDGVSLTVVEAGPDHFDHQPHPHHPRPHHPRHQAARRPGEPGGRRHRRVRRAPPRRPRTGRHPVNTLNSVAFTAFGQAIKWSDMIGNVIGLAALALGWRRSIWTWPAQLLSGLVLVAAYASAQLSGGVGKQLLVIAVAAWGWRQWTLGKQQAQDGSLAVRFATGKERALLCRRRRPRHPRRRGLFTLYPSLSWSPWADAYIFVGTLVAMVAQARGLVEFWFAWLLVDVVGVPSPSAAASPSPDSSTSSTARSSCGACATAAALPAARPGRSPRMTTAPQLAALPDWDAEDLTLDSAEQAVRDIAAGRPVVVVDDEDRENEGDLVIAAEKITPEIVAFMMSECRGLICAPMEGDELDRLELPQMVDDNTESMKTAFTVSVDAGPAHGVTTGISPPTARPPSGASPTAPPSRPTSSARPHLPAAARSGGVLVRPGHTEAAVDLARLAGLRPAGAIVEIAGEDGVMLRLPELVPFARKHGLTIVSIEDLIAHRRATEAPAALPADTDPTAPAGIADAGTEAPADRAAEAAVVHREAEVTLPPRTAPSPPTATAPPPTASSTSPSSTATSATATTCWSASTPSASPATSSTPCAATARRSCAPPWTGSPRPAAASSSTCAATRAAASACCPSSARTNSRSRAATPSTPTWSWACPADALRLRRRRADAHRPGVRSVRLLTNNPDKTDALTRHGIAVTGREPMPVQARRAQRALPAHQAGPHGTRPALARRAGRRAHLRGPVTPNHPTHPPVQHRGAT